MRTAIFTLLLLNALAQTTPSMGRVAMLTQQFAEAIKKRDPNLVFFYDDDAVMSSDDSFGFGGNFKGSRGVELALYRIFQAMDFDKPVQYQILGVDEARGTAILKVSASGHWTRTGKEFMITLLHVLEWNQVTGKIITHVVLDTNPSQTLADFRTDAENYFERMLWKFFRSSPEDLTDDSSPLWDLVSDKIQVRIHAYPHDLFTKTTWVGKDDVIRGFKEFHNIHHAMPMYKLLVTRPDVIDMKVLMSTNSDVWVRIGCRWPDKIVTHAIVHDTFDTDGKLTKEEIVLAHNARPWHIYPFPAPHQPEMTSEFRRLLQEKPGWNRPTGTQKVPFTDLLKQPQGEKKTVPFKDLTSIEKKKKGEEGDEKEQNGEKEDEEEEDEDKTEKAPQGEKKFKDWTQQTEKTKKGDDKETKGDEKEKKGESEDEETEDEDKEEKMFDEMELHMPIKVDIKGDVNTKFWGFGDLGSNLTKSTGKDMTKANQVGSSETMPPMEVEVHGDMKTNIVSFGSAPVDKVQLVGSIDKLDVWKPSLSFEHLHDDEKKLKPLTFEQLYEEKKLKPTLSFEHLHDEELKLKPLSTDKEKQRPTSELPFPVALLLDQYQLRGSPTDVPICVRLNIKKPNVKVVYWITGVKESTSTSSISGVITTSPTGMIQTRAYIPQSLAGSTLWLHYRTAVGDAALSPVSHIQIVDKTDCPQ